MNTKVSKYASSSTMKGKIQLTRKLTQISKTVHRKLDARSASVEAWSSTR